MKIIFLKIGGSFTKISGDISTMQYGPPTVVQAISQKIYFIIFYKPYCRSCGIK